MKKQQEMIYSIKTTGNNIHNEKKNRNNLLNKKQQEILYSIKKNRI